MFDPTKPVQTRDGRPARILATDFKGNFPIVAAVEFCDGTEIVYSYYDDGTMNRSRLQRGYDLINIPEDQELDVWVNVYDQEALLPRCHRTKAEADSYAAEDRIACIRIQQKYAVGEGLE